ncbi:hypothetical protein F4801DRAFT_548991 [Xylaria longipes]|nr:hypothetical protein F4801DRAFT_548991 [Xylaria longipes]
MMDTVAARALFEVHSSDDLIDIEENQKFLVFDEEQSYAFDHRLGSQYSTFFANETENGTPLRHVEPPSFLRITMDDIHNPKDYRAGFVFGCDSRECDVLLDENQRRGVSRKQFAIQPDWNAGKLILKNLSNQGTCLESRSLGRIVLHTERSLPDNEIVDVKLGPVEFRIRTPDHSNHRDVYLENWQAFRAKLESQPLGLQKLALETNKTTNKSLLTEYILGRQLGRGSQATVYRARHLISGRLCAIKQFDGLSSYNPNEVKILTQLDHRHIIKIYGSDVCNGNPLVVMELGGQDLQYVMDREPLSGAESKTALRQLFEAMDYLHDRGITHRDIKPANIVLHSRYPLWLKFTDFGAAAAKEDLKTYCGTPRYMAPELKRKEKSPYSNKADIWSLGIIALDFFYGLPDYPPPGKKRKAKWTVAIENHLASQQPKKHTWRFIHSLLQVDPHLRPSAKQALEHRFFATLAQPTQVFSPLQHHTSPTFENACEVSTIKGTSFYTTPQSPQAQISSSELSTIRPAPGRSIQATPSPSHHERTSHELSTVLLEAGQSIENIPSPSYHERGSRVPSNNGGYKSSSYDEDDTVRLLHHDNPLRNPLHVGSFVAKMGREKLPTVTEREEEGSQLPSYHAAQYESIRHVTMAASLPSNLDDDNLSMNHWHGPAFPGSNYNSDGSIGTRHNISHPASMVSESGEYYTAAEQGNSIRRQYEDITVEYAPTPGRAQEDMDAISISVQYAPTPGGAHEDPDAVYTPVEYAPTPGRSQEDLDAISFPVDYAPTPGALEDLDTIPFPFRSDSLVQAVIGQQRVSMRTSDSYLNATEICAAAGLDPRRSRKHLLPLKNRATGSINLEEMWVPFSDGVSLSRSLKLGHDLEQEFLRASEPPQEDILPSIEHDDELPESVSRTRGDRSQKRKRVGNHDKAILKEMFGSNPQPDKATCVKIASRVSLDEVQVADWFRHQQRKLKRNRKD